MCKISGVALANSIIPRLTWLILSLGQGDKQLTSVFGATYCMQFLVCLMVDVFVSGNLVKRAKGLGTTDEVNSGILASTVIAVVAAALLLVNIESWMSFMSIDIAYKEWMIYSIAYTCLLVPVNQVVELKYFGDQISDGVRVSLGFNIMYLVSVNILVYLVDIKEAVYLSIATLVVYVVVILVRNVEKFKPTFHILGGYKYCYSSLADNSLMFITYFFGMGAAFHYGSDFALAISVMAMATDVQWDLMYDSVYALAKTQIASGKANMHNLQLSSRVFVMLLTGSSIVMSLILCGVYGLNKQYMLTILAFEVVDMLMMQTKTVKKAWLNIEFGGKQLIVASTFFEVVRLLLSICVPSKYALWVGQVVNGALRFLYFSFVYDRQTKIKSRALKLVEAKLVEKAS